MASPTELFALLPQQREENQRRQAKGEPLLPDPEEAVEKELNIRHPQPLNRLDSLLSLEQLDAFCQQLEKTSGQGLGKMYVAEALQQPSAS